jgi:hypothetical protein
MGAYSLKDSNWLVGECMLLASYFLALQLLLCAGPRAIVRHHPPTFNAGPEKFVALADKPLHALPNTDTAVAKVERELNSKFCVSSAGRLRTPLRQLEARVSAHVETHVGTALDAAVTAFLTHPMRPVAYLTAGYLTQPAAWRHCALNIAHYTQFSFPIRKVVHRLLEASLLGKSAATGIAEPEASVASASPTLSATALLPKAFFAAWVSWISRATGGPKFGAASG